MSKNIFWIPLLCVMFLGGCAHDPSSVKSIRAPQLPQLSYNNPKGQLILALNAEPSLLNPLLSTDMASSSVEDLIFDALFKVNAKLELEPHLLKSYQFSKNGLECDFLLRNDVQWQDGLPLTADDVIFTFQKLMDPKTNTVRRSALMIEDRPILFEKTGMFSFKAVLPKPYAPFLVSMAQSILPKHLYEKENINTTALNRKPVGSGPFKLKEWKSGGYVLLERNENYFLGKPKLKAILYKIIPETNTRLMALQKGEIHVEAIPPKDLPRFVKNSQLNIFSYDQLFYYYMGFNLKGKFLDKRLRYAVAHAIDKKQLIRSVFKGLATPAYSPASPVSWSYESEVAKFDYAPEKTKKYLAEMGYTLAGEYYEKSGKALEFELLLPQGSRDGQKAAVIMQEYLKRAGIKMNIREMEWTALLKIVNNPGPKQFDAVMIGWSLGLDPDTYALWHSKEYPKGFNFVGYYNQQVDKLSVQGRETLERAQRQKIYSQIQKQIAQDQPYYFLWYPKTITAVSKKVGGYDAKPGPAGLFLEIEKVFITP
jgi:peptide/nickel transport system substrate-binding protein